MNNQQRIPPIEILNAINLLKFDNEPRKKINELWNLYLRLYQHDPDQCVEEMETVLQEIDNDRPHTQRKFINAINQKINSVEREISGDIFNGGLKRRKTSKKRKRTTNKTSNKRSNKRRKRRN